MARAPNALQLAFGFGLAVAIGSCGVAQEFQPITAPAPSSARSTSGNGDSMAPVISPDGRYVLFSSTANNLVAAPGTNVYPAQLPSRLNAFLRDRTNGTTTLVSLNLAGDGGGNGDSLPVAISTNGRYVLFESGASDLISGDTNKSCDVFMRDLVAQTTWLVSASTNGEVPQRFSGFYAADSGSATMTPDGRCVAFTSSGVDLVPGQPSYLLKLYLRDVMAGTNTMVGGAVSDSPAVTPDGRYVAYYTNMEIHVRDLSSGADTWASCGALAALQASFTNVTRSVSYSHQISDDGRFVVYQAHAVAASMPLAALVLRFDQQSGVTDVIATNASVPLMAQVTSPLVQVPFRDRRFLQMTPDGQRVVFLARLDSTVSTNTAALLWNAQDGTTALVNEELINTVPTNSQCAWPSIDPTGRFVLFVCSEAVLVTNRLRGDYHLYLRDMQAGTTTLVDVDTNGIGAGLNAGSMPQMSADGRFVVFESYDNQLVPGDGNRAADVFMRDVVAGTTELISARHPDLACVAPNGSSILSLNGVSADGRYVAFASEADNLVDNDTNEVRDVFVRDTVLGTNLLVSVNLAGTGPGNGPSSDPAVSADGRFIAFTSSASDLVAGDTNKTSDVFIRDLETGMTAFVSVNTNSAGPGNGDSYAPVISSDGRRVLFRSKAVNLAPPPGPVGGSYDCLFMRDLQTQVTYALNTSVGRNVGTPSAAMTPDGRFVAFVEGSGSGRYFLWDSQAAARVYTNTLSGCNYVWLTPDGRTMVCSGPTSPGLRIVDCVSNVTSSFLTAGQPFVSAGVRFSGDGRFMTYVYGASLFRRLVCVFDLVANSRSQIAELGAETGSCGSPSISPDGRFVAFRSFTNNVPGDVNGLPDLFLFDRQTGSTTLLSVNAGGTTTGQNWPLTPVFSADGQTLVFQSWGSDLVPQDLNPAADIFMVRLFSSAPIPLFAAQIISGTSAGQQPTISWPAMPGKSYRLQYKSALSDIGWVDITGGISIVGDKGYFRDPSPAPDQRFYRVVGF